MKRFLFLVTVVVVTFAASYLAIVHYKNKQADSAQVAAVQKSLLESADARQQAEIQALTTKLQATQLECQKGKAAYDNLTVAQKAKITAPVCQN